MQNNKVSILSALTLTAEDISLLLDESPDFRSRVARLLVDEQNSQGQAAFFHFAWTGIGRYVDEDYKLNKIAAIKWFRDAVHYDVAVQQRWVASMDSVLQDVGVAREVDWQAPRAEDGKRRPGLYHTKVIVEQLYSRMPAHYSPHHQ